MHYYQDCYYNIITEPQNREIDMTATTKNQPKHTHLFPNIHQYYPSI